MRFGNKPFIVHEMNVYIVNSWRVCAGTARMDYPLWIEVSDVLIHWKIELNAEIDQRRLLAGYVHNPIRFSGLRVS